MPISWADYQAQQIDPDSEEADGIIYIGDESDGPRKSKEVVNKASDCLQSIFWIGVLLAVLGFGGFLCWLLTAPLAKYFPDHYKTTEVTGEILFTFNDGDLDGDSNNSSPVFFVVILREDGEREFIKNVDQAVYSKKDSDDLQLSLSRKEGYTCTFVLSGKRDITLEKFRNIIEVKNCQPKQ